MKNVIIVILFISTQCIAWTAEYRQGPPVYLVIGSGVAIDIPKLLDSAGVAYLDSSIELFDQLIASNKGRENLVAERDYLLSVRRGGKIQVDNIAGLDRIIVFSDSIDFLVTFCFKDSDEVAVVRIARADYTRKPAQIDFRLRPWSRAISTENWSMQRYPK